jgi:hypothetical protein
VRLVHLSVPLEWFLAPGVRLDLRGLEHEYCQIEKLPNLGAVAVVDGA